MNSNVSQLLQQIEDGDAAATEQLLPLVYHELRRLASRKMTHENAGHTLQPTALVHEAFLRLVGGKESQVWDSRHSPGTRHKLTTEIPPTSLRIRRHSANAS